MTETEFNNLVDKALVRIEEAIEESGVDIECEITSGILEMTFENGSKIIVNRQGAAQELWVAAKSGGFHYKWKDDAWINTRDGSEFFGALSGYVTDQAGEKVVITPVA
jgi:CyaY protein